MYPFKSNHSAQGKSHEPDNNSSTQWPLNQAAYQNVANDQVDWAALAQQWIYMKETCTTDDLLTAPPPPIISKPDFRDEKGEAPMEVEKEDEQTVADFSHPSTGAEAPANWQQNSYPPSQQQQQPWRKKPGWNTWTNPNIVPAPPATIRHILPDPFAAANDTSENDAPVDFRSDGYWQRFANNADRLDTNTTSKINATLDELPSPLDAAKRKTLPAWIRQGLEKMEREKQKCAEKEKERREHNERVERRMLDQPAATDGNMPLFVKSKFDSDSESEDETKTIGKLSTPDMPSHPKTIVSLKSRQEKLHDLMLLVRGSLTEILLEVTNEEIRNVASETLSNMRLKARTAQTVKKSALTSLTGGLGLGIYADSDNSDESSENGDDDAHSDSDSDGNDSYVELQETVRRRKLSFEAKAKEIEIGLAIEDEKEKRWLGDDVDDGHESKVALTDASVPPVSGRMAGTSDKDIGEVQPEKIYISHGRHNAERKTTRFSDPKDTVKNLHVTHGSIIYETLSVQPMVVKNGPPVGVAKRQQSYHGSKASSDSSSCSTDDKKSTKTTHKYKRSRRDRRSSSDDSESTERYRRKRVKSRDRSHRRKRKSRSSSADERSRSHRSYGSRHADKRSAGYDDDNHEDDDDEDDDRKSSVSKRSSSSITHDKRNQEPSKKDSGHQRRHGRGKRSRSRSKDTKYSHHRY